MGKGLEELTIGEWVGIWWRSTLGLLVVSLIFGVVGGLVGLVVQFTVASWTR